MTVGPLRGTAFAVADDTPASRRGGELLTLLGASVLPFPPPTDDAVPVRATHPNGMAAWAAGGGAWLTGADAGPPLGGPAAVGMAMDAAGAAFGALTRWAGRAVGIDGAALLGERAAAWGHGRAGRCSAGGACRLLAARDGWVAVNLPRPEDRELLPAWLGIDPPRETLWTAVATAVHERTAAATATAGQDLGLPVAAAVTPRAAMSDAQAAARGQSWPPTPWRIVTHRDAGRNQGPRPRPPLVVDLSSLWAGPLATRLLADGGAQVIKVESTRRPDGARAGPAAFFDRYNAGKAMVALDLRTEAGVAVLRRLLGTADIVVEASRPRALDQLGCGPDDLLGTGRDQVWVSITGYGRTGPWRQRAALGDDAGVAGGLAVTTAAGPFLCADAVADPIAGLHAALAALACWHGGGTHHVDVAMREAAAACVPDEPDGPGAAPEAVWHDDDWWFGPHRVQPPRIPPSPRAGALGADTARVLYDLLEGGA